MFSRFRRLNASGDVEIGLGCRSTVFVFRLYVDQTPLARPRRFEVEDLLGLAAYADGRVQASTCPSTGRQIHHSFRRCPTHQIPQQDRSGMERYHFGRTLAVEGTWRMDAETFGPKAIALRSSCIGGEVSTGEGASPGN